MTTAQYRKRCFDKIEPVMAENKDLTAEVAQLRQRLEAIEKEKAVQESQNLEIVVQLGQREREKANAAEAEKIARCPSAR